MPFELIATTVLHAIFFLFVSLLPKSFTRDLKQSLVFLKVYLVVSYSAVLVLSGGLLFIDLKTVFYTGYLFLVMFSFYLLYMSVVTKHSSLSNRKRSLCLFVVLTLEVVIFYVFDSFGVSAFNQVAVVTVILAIALFSLVRTIRKLNQKGRRGPIYFSRFLMAAIFILLASIPLAYVTDVVGIKSAFSYMSQVHFVTTSLIMFGIGTSLMFRVMRVLQDNINRDRLTGVYNRNYFYDVAAKMVCYSDKKVRSSLFMCDIDDFKKINDTYGHVAGDLVLVEFASLLKASFRQQDVVIRMGGEEFLILLPNLTAEEALKAANRVLEKVTNLEIEYQNRDITFSISGGVSNVDFDLGVDENIARADQALYSAKRAGKNNILAFTG